jgi:hypothetical protein
MFKAAQYLNREVAGAEVLALQLETTDLFRRSREEIMQKAQPRNTEYLGSFHPTRNFQNLRQTAHEESVGCVMLLAWP